MSMSDPESFLKYTKINKSSSKVLLDEIKDQLKWSEDEHVLDVGCGPGDLTTEILRKYLPDNSKIVGADISKNMIDFAKRRYTDENLSFKIADICDKDLLLVNREQFSKIFSFFCLQRVHDQRKAYENMYNLLKPGGELITITPTESCMELILPYLAEMPKYSKYAEEISKMRVHLNPTQNYINRTTDTLKEAGFKVKLCKYFNKTFCAPSVDYLVEFYGIVSYLSRILPSNLFEEALLDAKKIVIDNDLFERTSEGFLLKYVVLVVIGEKPL